MQGHDPVESCPNFGETVADLAPSTESNEVQTEPTDEIRSEPMLQLASGQALTQSEVDGFLLRRNATLVAIVGDTSSGKSTLMCSLYDRFQRGKFADRSFVASTTLGAFEQLAHLSRAASGALTPDTKRTYLSEGLQYYHLATAPLTGGQRYDLLLSDRAGETYRSGMSRPAELAELSELQLARVVVVLVDGARLSETTEQHQVLDSARRIVRAMIDGGAIKPKQHLQLVLTKRDEVERADDTTDIVDRLKEVVSRLAADFGTKLASVSFFEIAARDPHSGFELAFGCDALLTSWMNCEFSSTSHVPQSQAPSTRFDRLAENEVLGVQA